MKDDIKGKEWMTHNSFDYKAMLRKRGYRVTPQRQLIMDAICEGHGHTSLDAIFSRARAKDPTLNLATVYRTLEFLCNLNLVVAAVIKGQTVYEIAGIQPHHHLVCRKCGEVEDLDLSLARDFFHEVEQATGFDVDVNHLTLFGLCSGCRAAFQANLT